MDNEFLMPIDSAIEEYNEHIKICSKCSACPVPPSESCDYAVGLRDGIAIALEEDFGGACEICGRVNGCAEDCADMCLERIKRDYIRSED